MAARRRAARVLLVDDSPAIVVPGSAARAVAKWVEWALRVGQRAGHPPSSTALDLVDAARAAAAAEEQIRTGSAGGTGALSAVSTGRGWMTVNEVASSRGITSRAVRAGAARERFPGAVNKGREWAIPVTDVEKEMKP